MNRTDAEVIKDLESENARLRRTITILERQVEGLERKSEIRRLRAKLAEWEGTSALMNGGYYHGSRFILPYLDDEEQVR